MSGDAVLELRDVRKIYGSTVAVNDVSVSIAPGEVFTLLGPSGCGKSTTLRIVAGLEEPDAGEVLLDGRLIASGSRGFSLPPERRDLGMVFQSYAIWPHMTVFDNVAFPLQLRKEPKSVIQQKVENVLDLVGLSGLGGRGATDLSGGQQQRVALARAIVYEPKLLLLDEPLSNLDAKLREHMRIELRALQQRLGIAVLFVTHDQGEAMVLSDRIAVMRSGHLEQVGTPVTLYERPASPFVRDFLGRVHTVEVSLASVECAEAPGEPALCFSCRRVARARVSTVARAGWYWPGGRRTSRLSRTARQVSTDCRQRSKPRRILASASSMACAPLGGSPCWWSARASTATSPARWWVCGWTQVKPHYGLGSREH